MLCPKCKEDKLKHLHACAHGIEGTHMKGTERYECDCGFYVGDKEDAEQYDLEFTLDT